LTIKDGCSQKIERQNQRAVKSDIAKKELESIILTTKAQPCAVHEAWARR
jgi:hypothetical protein